MDIKFLKNLYLYLKTDAKLPDDHPIVVDTIEKIQHAEDELKFCNDLDISPMGLSDLDDLGDNTGKDFDTMVDEIVKLYSTTKEQVELDYVPLPVKFQDLPESEKKQRVKETNERLRKLKQASNPNKAPMPTYEEQLKIAEERNKETLETVMSVLESVSTVNPEHIKEDIKDLKEALKFVNKDLAVSMEEKVKKLEEQVTKLENRS